VYAACDELEATGVQFQVRPSATTGFRQTWLSARLSHTIGCAPRDSPVSYGCPFANKLFANKGLEARIKPTPPTRTQVAYSKRGLTGPTDGRRRAALRSALRCTRGGGGEGLGSAGSVHYHVPLRLPRRPRRRVGANTNSEIRSDGMAAIVFASRFSGGVFDCIREWAPVCAQ
jgi:hypothetical protein